MGVSFADLISAADRVALSVFGEPTPVTYAPEVGDPVSTTPSGAPLIGIFDEQYVLAKGTAEAGVEALGPAVFFRLEDLPVDPEEDEPTITIRGVGYTVTEHRPDGMGGIVLALRRA